MKGSDACAHMTLCTVPLWHPAQVRTLVAQPSEQGRAPAEVTRLAAAPDSPHVAAGHADGSVRIWNLDTGNCEVQSTSFPRLLLGI